MLSVRFVNRNNISSLARVILSNFVVNNYKLMYYVTVAENEIIVGAQYIRKEYSRLYQSKYVDVVLY